MAQTPLPHGEPPRPRSAEVRWFEPLAGQDAAARRLDPRSAHELRWPEPASVREAARPWLEPAIPREAIEWAAGGEDDWCTAPDLRRRDTVQWREVRWVGFAGDADRLDEPADPDAETASPPSADETAGRAEEHPVRVPAVAAAARRIGGFFTTLLRLGAAIVAIAFLAGALYRGGQHLAMLAEATPHASPVDRSAPAAAEGDRAAAAAAPPATGQAAYYLERAEAGEAAAQYDIAALYVRGDGVAQDFPAAVSWFRKAAQGGSAAAAFDLGVMYERGLGVKPNPEEAAAWYRYAAARNYASAQFNLAVAYAEGRGVPQDWADAARLYRDAAAQGLLPAMVNFAILCERGEGTARSLPKAYAWYRAAARRGDAVATQRARELFEQMDVGQKGPALMLASATADALHDSAAESPKAAPPVDQAPRRTMEAGGWLAGAKPTVKRQPSAK